MKDRDQEVTRPGIVLCLLVALSVVYFLGGGAITGVVVWLFVDGLLSAVLTNSLLLFGAASILLIAGFSLLMLSILGIAGSMTKNTTIILSYFMLLVCLFLLMLVSGIIAVVFRSKVSDEMRGVMKETLLDYYGTNDGSGKVRAITDAWDKAQNYLDCCGVDDYGWRLYRESSWFKIQPGVPWRKKPYVPESCCKKKGGEYISLNLCQKFMEGPPLLKNGQENVALHYRGCYRPLLNTSGYILIGLAFGMTVLLLCGSVFSMYLYILLRRDK